VGTIKPYIEKNKENIPEGCSLAFSWFGLIKLSHSPNDKDFCDWNLPPVLPPTLLWVVFQKRCWFLEKLAFFGKSA
jgi:hypothetical protein